MGKIGNNSMIKKKNIKKRIAIRETKNVIILRIMQKSSSKNTSKKERKSWMITSMIKKEKRTAGW